MKESIIVIGGGASGMMASGIAASRGYNVTLLEKNNTLGKKLAITGKGRCNLTNATDIQGLIDNIPGNGNFLYSAINAFTNSDLIDFFKGLEVNTKIERGNRVFPVSDKARDVVNALIKFLGINKVNIKLNCNVKTVEKINDGFMVSMDNGYKMSSEKLIIATGGITYPKTGSTGDGYKFARQLGHKIIDAKPSLVPLTTNENWVYSLQGLTLKNVGIKLKNKNKLLYEDFGEMLFTHFGVSGPIILSSSRHLVNLDISKEDINLAIDLKPALTEEQLDKRIQRDFEKYTRKQFKNSLDELLPQKLIPIIIDFSEINPEKPVNQISKGERAKLINSLKNLSIKINGTRPIDEGIITCGGVAVNQVNPHTMESKLVKGLYFTGEVLDVDGYTGGYNLQIAFSTGYAAGMNI